MIRGCQRQMVVLETRESDLFECAYLVLRRARYTAKGTEMLAEAERLVGDGSRYVSRRQRRRAWLPFCFGALLGAAVGAGLFLLFHAIARF